MLVCFDELFTLRMAVYMAFSDCVVYNYKTTICSKATLFIFLIKCATVLFPLLIAYRSNGFWLKRDTYIEQADVHFKHEYLLIAETHEVDSPVICSTFTLFDDMLNKHNHCSMIKSREDDFNRDGIFDEMYFEVEIQLTQMQKLHSVKLFLLFDYKLYKMSYFQMEAMGVVQQSSSLPGARLDVAADLVLIQKQPLASHGRNVHYNHSVFPKSFPQQFDLSSILREYSQRNISAYLQNTYALWTTGRAADVPFVLSVVIHYPEATVIYKPGFWHMIKWAWMQYLSVVVLFIWLFRTIQSYVFRNHLVSSVKEIPWKKIT